MKIKLLLLLICLFFAIASQSFAVVYRCVDSQGKKTFTDSECEKLALKFLNPSQAPAVIPAPVPGQPILNQVQRPSMPRSQSHLYVKPLEKRQTNFNIWTGTGYTGFLHYFFLFIISAGMFFLFMYLVLFLKERFRKRTSGIADAKY